MATGRMRDRLRRSGLSGVLGREVPVARKSRARLLGLALLIADRAGDGPADSPLPERPHLRDALRASTSTSSTRDGAPTSVRRAVSPEPGGVGPGGGRGARGAEPDRLRGGRTREPADLTPAMLPERDEIATIVVCEDDEPTLELLCDHLTADRFGAMPAPSASDALRLCRYKQPDLLLLDLALPDASGLDVLREIRDVGRRRLRVRPEAAGDRAHRPRRRRRPGPRLRDRGRRLRRQAFPLPGAAGPDRGGPAAPLRSPRGPRRVGEIVVDPARRKAWVGDREVALSNKEFSLLRVLAAEPTPCLHQGRPARRGLGLPDSGPDPDARLAREPATAQAGS